MKGTNEDTLKYYFTKYVEVAVGRAKKDYLNKQKYHGQWEIPTEPEILQEMMRKGDLDVYKRQALRNSTGSLRII